MGTWFYPVDVKGLISTLLKTARKQKHKSPKINSNHNWSRVQKVHRKCTHSIKSPGSNPLQIPNHGWVSLFFPAYPRHPVEALDIKKHKKAAARADGPTLRSTSTATTAAAAANLIATSTADAKTTTAAAAVETKSRKNQN